MRPKVYIAGPYSSPDPVINTRLAMEWWHTLWRRGFAPFCPHLSHLLHLHIPLPYEQWLDYDNEWVVICRALFRFNGASSGADKEEQLAKAAGLPIFYESDNGLRKLCEWADKGGMARTDSRLDVFRLVGLEREYQDQKWGGNEFDDTHGKKDWVHWINEYANGTGRAADYGHEVRMQKVAALAFAALEQADRLDPTILTTLINDVLGRLSNS